MYLLLLDVVVSCSFGVAIRWCSLWVFVVLFFMGCGFGGYTAMFDMMLIVFYCGCV